MEDLYKKIVRYKSYWGKDGGITVSGGEPLLNPYTPIIIKKAKELGIQIIDEETIIDSKEFLSNGKSTPFDGFKVYGKNYLTVSHNDIVYKLKK